MGRGEGRVFIGNLPRRIGKKDVKKLCGRFGNVIYVDFKPCTFRPAFAFVRFADLLDADNAVRYGNGCVFKGHKIRIEYPSKNFSNAEMETEFSGDKKDGRKVGTVAPVKMSASITPLPEPSEGDEDEVFITKVVINVVRGHSCDRSNMPKMKDHLRTDGDILLDKLTKAFRKSRGDCGASMLMYKNGFAYMSLGDFSIGVKEDLYFEVKGIRRVGTATLLELNVVHWSGKETVVEVDFLHPNPKLLNLSVEVFYPTETILKAELNQWKGQLLYKQGLSSQ